MVESFCKVCMHSDSRLDWLTQYLTWHIFLNPEDFMYMQQVDISLWDNMMIVLFTLGHGVCNGSH